MKYNDDSDNNTDMTYKKNFDFEKIKFQKSN